MYKSIEASIPVRYFPWIVIIGLVLGITLKAYQVPEFFAGLTDNTVVYAQEAAPEVNCVATDYHCVINEMLVEIAHKNYEANREHDLEQYRLEAMPEVRDIILSQMDDSPFVNYDELKERYGY